jgi:hypothetical protein
MSCEKNKVKNDDEAPTIEVQEPAAESEVDSIFKVSALFLDNTSLVEYTMKVGDETGEVITGFDYSESEVIGSAEKNFITDFIYGTNITIPESVAATEIYLHFELKDGNDNLGVVKHKLLLKQ